MRTRMGCCEADNIGNYTTNTEGVVQIRPCALSRDPANLASFIGSWIHSTEELAASFAAAHPLPHVVIDGFFEADFAHAMAEAFPPADGPLWHVYDNPLERKRACSNTAQMPDVLRAAIEALCGPSIVEAVRLLTGNTDAELLQADPYCHGGGLHSHVPGGKLDLHLDYSLHPTTGLERRYNLIVYLSEEWRESYGGALELWAPSEQDPTRPGQLGARIPPLFNRAVLFDTAAPAFHGFPQVRCLLALLPRLAAVATKQIVLTCAP